MFKELRQVLLDVVHLRDTTDVRGTIDNIRNSIVIKGYNVWILACGAMLASIGLDTNSAAVIIGAMLISPLMSPILGIGLSVGINDREHLVLALKNFGIAVGASLGVSLIYFLITPLGRPTEEIMNRTYPTILDVLVAIFGGIAGIVAGSRKDKTNAIPGVAIATALMPPLCVSGFGMAGMIRGDLPNAWEIFGGALYLFFINSVFIALSTYLIVRFLRFPFVDYVDDRTRRRAVRWTTAFAVLVILPSVYFMYNVWLKARVESDIDRFIIEQVNNANHEAIKRSFEMNDSLSTLSLVMAGPPLTQDSIRFLVEQLPDYGLEDFRLNILQSPGQLRKDELLDESTLKALEAVQPGLMALQGQIDSLHHLYRRQTGDTVLLRAMRQEMGALFPDLESFGLAQEAVFPGNKALPDTLAVLLPNWKPNLRASARREQEARLVAWLRLKLDVDTLLIARP
ncbi:MAG: DUF389 domain-containing protein [Bacteroidetes bacterium]|nr:MAG: DUF389 domain-containing protein [Bacteroidota bacterium]